MTKTNLETMATLRSSTDNQAYAHTLLGKLESMVFKSIWSRWILAGIMATILIAPTVIFVIKIHQTEYSEYRHREKHRTAVGRWLPDALALQDGGDPYGNEHWFPSSPLVLIALVPFAHMPITATAVVWSLLKIAAVLAACALVVASAARQSVGLPLGVMLMAAVFSTRPIIGDITHGNINIFVFLEIALAWYLFVTHRDIMAGVLIGLAIVTKVTPALLLVYFLYKRSWRVVLGAGIGLALFGLVVPSAILGVGRNIELLQGWFSLMIEPYALNGFVTIEPKNQSLPATLLRLADHFGWIATQQLSPAQALRYGAEVGTMIKPATFAGQMIPRAAGLMLVGSLAWLCRFPVQDRRSPRLFLELALVLLAMLLLSERTWKHHLVTFPIIFLATWQVLTCYPWSDRFRLCFVVGLIVQFILLVVVRSKIAMFGGALTLGMLLCFFQIAILLRRLKHAPT